MVPYENLSNTYLSDTGSDLLREQIKTGFESVVRVQNTVTYRTYQFHTESLAEKSEVSGADLDSLSARSFIESHSNAGTATILSNKNERTSLFTASHVVTFPDTIFHNSPGSNQLLEAVSIKQSVSHFFFGSSGVFEFEILANDPDRDLALLVYRWGRDGDPGLVALTIEPGDFDDLDWTDRVYALGYPRGVRMVTSGMISRQEGNSRRTFAVDAIFNRGFSGGPIFAVRTDGSGLEWMGILTSSSAENEFYLGPDYLNEDELSQGRPFTGTPVIQQTSRINYGVSFGVDIHQIADFFNENRSLLRRMRIPVPDFPD